MEELNRISFRVSYNFFDCLVSEFLLFCSCKRPRIYFACTILLCFFLVILATEGFLQISICVFCYILGMWGLVFLHRIELAIDSAIQFRKYTDKDKVNFLDKEKGLGFKTEDSGGNPPIFLVVLYKWSDSCNL